MTPKYELDHNSISHMPVSKIETEKKSLLEKLAVPILIIGLTAIYFYNQHAKKPAKDVNHNISIPAYSNSLGLDTPKVQKKLYSINKITPAADYGLLGPNFYKK